MTRDEKDYFDRKFNKVEDCIGKNSERIDKNDDTTDKLRVIVTGNGSIGHEQRIGSLENWRAKRPQECPHMISKKQIYARRAVDAAIIGLILTAALFVLEKWVI